MNMHDGRVVLVTGGAIGIGAGICQAFAESGASVSVADIDGDAAHQFADKLKSDGHRAVAITGDVSVLNDAERMVNESIESLGALDILVNNAGIQPTASYMNAEHMDEATWDRIIAVNLKGQFLMAKFSIPYIRARGGGTIINIASVQGLQSQPLVPAYAASKGGSLSLTRNMALDFAADNIRVVAINPGTIDTPLARGAARAFGDEEELLQLWGSAHPLGRIGTPKDIGSAAVFLASDGASFITGESVNVDGGYMALGAWAAGTD
mgnify:FL=1